MAELKLHIYKLRFRAPVHLGEVGVGVEKVAGKLIHSDTLWAAITHAWARLFGTDPPTTNAPPFRLSSAFPFRNTELYFPMPTGFQNMINMEFDPALSKRLKKVQFLGLPMLEHIINGELLTEQHVERIIKDSEHLKLNIKEELEPHVVLGRTNMASQIYYVGSTWFSSTHSDVGLYFMVKFSDESLKSRFDAIMNFLADEGIGGRRTYGFGKFEPPESEELILHVPDEPDRFMTVSRIIPEPELLSHLDQSKYRLYRLKGWAMGMGGQALRKTVWMIEEGAIFPIEPRGKIVDLTPSDWKAPHRIYRHGLALSLPMRRMP